jgi:hypothetical protein
MKRLPAGARKVLGSGLSVVDWIRLNPDRFVTRREIGLLFGMLKHAEQRVAKYALLRRFWRWLLTPILGHTEEAPSTPLPSSSSSSPAPAGPTAPSVSDSGLASAGDDSRPNVSSSPVPLRNPRPGA